MFGKAGLIVAVTALSVLTACGTAKAPTTHPSSPSPVRNTPATPQSGTCHALTFTTALGSSDPTPSVACTQTHTAVTVAVGTLADPSQAPTDINSASVQQRLAVDCPKAVHTYVGGDDTTFDLSMIQAVWFIPTTTEIARGATWYRCDLVVVSGTNQLAPLPPTMQNALAAPNALNQWGICGTAAPSDKAFARILCSTPHTWRAVSLVQLPPTAGYLDKTVAANASNSCRDVASKAAKGALKFTWSFEWPNEQKWQAGQRYGWCWLPSTS